MSGIVYGIPDIPPDISPDIQVKTRHLTLLKYIPCFLIPSMFFQSITYCLLINAKKAQILKSKEKGVFIVSIQRSQNARSKVGINSVYFVL